INRIEEPALEEKLESPALQRWAPWLRDQRAWRPYQLEEAVERVLHEKRVTGRAAWTRLFDETMSSLRFELDGEQLTETEVLDKFPEARRSLRHRAAPSSAKGLKEHEPLLALVTNPLARGKALEDGWRGLSRPVSARRRAERVVDAVADGLVEALAEAYPRR